MGQEISKGAIVVRDVVRTIFGMAAPLLAQWLTTAVASWLALWVEGPTEKDVRGATELIERAKDPETTAKYVTAKRERDHLNKAVDKSEANLDPDDKKLADEALLKMTRKSSSSLSFTF